MRVKTHAFQLLNSDRRIYMLHPVYSKVLLEATSSAGHIVKFKGDYFLCDLWLFSNVLTTDLRTLSFSASFSPQPRCWSVDATLPTSCWWVLGRREPTAQFSSASGSWSRMSLKAKCSPSEREKVLRPPRTSRRPSTGCASVICKKRAVKPSLPLLRKTKVCTLIMARQSWLSGFVCKS